MVNRLVSGVISFHGILKAILPPIRDARITVNVNMVGSCWKWRNTGFLKESFLRHATLVDKTIIAGFPSYVKKEIRSRFSRRPTEREGVKS